MTRSLCKRGNPTHEGAANTENMNMHEGGFYSASTGIILDRFTGGTHKRVRKMPRENRIKQVQMRVRIAAAAARLMAEDGIDDFALAKRKAARQLGAPDSHSLPTNEEVETELKAYQALYQGEEQRERIQELREIALDAMAELGEFNPYVSGAVLKGTAGRYADIDLQLFTDDLKSVEFYFLNRDVPYEVSEQRHYSGDEVRPAQMLHVQWRGVPLNLAVYPANDERRVLKGTPSGRNIERANLAALRALLATDS